MGQTTPNIGIYIPAAGETNYDAPFASGMVNIDQHDHSGGPNKGVPIATSGIADGSITYSKLNPNVADNTTGIGTNTGSLANQLIILGLLKSIFNLSNNGLIVKNGTNSSGVMLTSMSGQLVITNPDGTTGNPDFALASTVPSNYASVTFTPALAFGGASTGITYTTQYGRYTRIGNMCFVTIDLLLSSKGSATGAATLTGLPFTSINEDQPGRLVVIPSRITLDANYTQVYADVVANALTANLMESGSGQSTAVIDDTYFAATSRVSLTGIYLTA